MTTTNDSKTTRSVNAWSPLDRWRAVLVDDESPARSHLRQLLAVHPNVDIVGEAECVAEAVAVCARVEPTLLFLDLQMPRGSGFDLLAQLNPMPEVIFVTAHDAYAVRAFEVGAVDYLLKPIFEDRLEIALTRLGGTRSVRLPAHGARLNENAPVFLRTDRGLRVALVHRLTHIVADGNYTTVWIDDGVSYLIDRTMNEWESLLPTPCFLRLDRSLLVNTAHLSEVEHISRNFSRLKFTGRSSWVEIGRIARIRLKSELDKL